MPIAWPKHLVSDLARRRCVIFLGAGVSANCLNDRGESPPGWEEFIKSAASELLPTKRAEIEDLVVRKDLLGAGERLKAYRGADLIEDIRRLFTRPRYQPADIHRHILDLDPRIVVTTNFDKIYDSHANAPGPTTLSGSLIVKNFGDKDIVHAFRSTDRVLIRLHGSADTIQDLILTRSDYARARVELRNSYEALEALILTHTFLFLGYSLRDPDLQIILESHAMKYPNAKSHYVCIGGAVSDLDRDFNRNVMRVELLPYDIFITPAGTQDHSDLTRSMLDLVPLVETERKNLRDTLEW